MRGQTDGLDRQPQFDRRCPELGLLRCDPARIFVVLMPERHDHGKVAVGAEVVADRRDRGCPIRYSVAQIDRQRRVEAALERQLVRVCLDGREAVRMVSRDLRHRRDRERGIVDAHDMYIAAFRNVIGDAPSAAAEVEHALPGSEIKAIEHPFERLHLSHALLAKVTSKHPPAQLRVGRARPGPRVKRPILAEMQIGAVTIERHRNGRPPRGQLEAIGAPDDEPTIQKEDADLS